MHGNKTLAVTVSAGFYDVCLMVAVKYVSSLFHGPESPFLFFFCLYALDTPETCVRMASEEYIRPEDK